MKKVVFLLFLSAAIGSRAQVTLQAADLNPQVGESYPISRTSWMDAGAGGSNATWDLSSLSIEATGQLTILAPAVAYPGTSCVLSIDYNDGYTSNAWVETSLSGQWSHGFQFGGSGVTLTYDYTNSQQMLQFPLTMGASFTDNYAGPFNLAGMTGTRTGTVTYEVDGYGTLITGYGIYTDVLRVRLERADTDVSVAGTINASTRTYLWYKAGIHYPVAYLTEDLLDASYNEGGILASGSLGFKKNELTNIRMFPNPAQDHVLIEAPLGGIARIEITTMDGKLIDEIEQFDTTMLLDVSDWNSGVYLFRISGASGEEVLLRLLK